MTCYNTLPTRRERLRAYCKLKFENRLLRFLLVPAALALPLAGLAVAETERAPEAVPIGKGIAGVDSALTDPAPASPAVPESDMGSGDASFYGNEFAGRPTASGESFNPAGFTAAHRTLPMGSRVRVTLAGTGRSVVVRINDRGPFHGNRAIDLSEGAARKLGMLASGTARVRISLIRSA